MWDAVDREFVEGANGKLLNTVKRFYCECKNEWQNDKMVCYRNEYKVGVCYVAMIG